MKVIDDFYVERVEKPIISGHVVWPTLNHAIVSFIPLAIEEEKLGRKMTEEEIFELFKKDLKALQKGS